MASAQIRLLGKVAVLVDGHELDAGPDRQRCVLVALAVDVGRVVSIERLTERVWGEQPPLRARATLLSYLSRLRNALAAAGTPAVIRRSGGYALEIEPSAVDLHSFRDLCAQARALLDDDERKAHVLEEALALWGGEALTGLSGEWAAAERDQMQRERLAAEYDLTDVLLRLGHGEKLVPGLATRASESPWDERIAGQYVLALHRAGRTADALAHYRRVQTRLAEDLGCDPGPALQRLHQQILAADPELTTTPRPAAATRSPVPRQLPVSSAPLIGRRRELDRLDAALNDAAAGATVISAIAGVGGIGKTLLALHWAHRNADRFPDGQLFVDLRGFSPDAEPMDPATAVRGFLDALDVDPRRIPADPHAQAALFRSLVAGKRMLVVLDNAATTAQVVPLLPGSPTATVLVTSRHHLSGLIATKAAQHLPLDVLSDAEAHAMLTDRLGQPRTAAEPAAARELVQLCGGFPLALGIVASNAATRPGVSLADLTVELRDLGLSALDGPEPAASLPTVLSWSLRHLTGEQRRMFALLGVAPGPDVSLSAAASLLGESEKQTHVVLRTLAESSLVDNNRGGRYSMHDLVRTYATTVADSLPADIRETALRRILDFYVHTAHAAELLLGPHNEDLCQATLAPGVRPRPLADAAAAHAWFENEHSCLLAAQLAAVDRAWHDTAWQLASNLASYQLRSGRRHDQLLMWRTAARAATHLPDPVVHIRTHRILGLTLADLNQHDEAIDHLHRALALAEQEQEPTHQSRVHMAFTCVLERTGDDRQALEHARRALDLSRGRGQPRTEADGLAAVGWYAALVGDYDTARHHCQAALALYRRHEYPFGEATVLDTLAHIDGHNGHYAEAVDHYRRSITLLRDNGNSYHVANTLDRLGHSHAAFGQIDQARAAWQEALEMIRQQGRDHDAQRVQGQLAALGH